jgi:hypothetical protein
LQAQNAPQFPAFKAAKDDYETKFPVVLSQVERKTQISDAFRALQTAENVRHQSPQAYQDARIRYYTLVNGEGWIDQEKERIAQAEAIPKATQYEQIKGDLKTRLNQQQQTIDVVSGVKDKILTMKDDFAYTTNAFSKQISDLKNQINIEKKKPEIEKEKVVSWVDTLLNVLILSLLIGLVVVVIRKVAAKNTDTSLAYRSPYSIM